MPIVNIQVVIAEADAPVGPDRVQALADALGEHFESESGGTWVRVSLLPARQYAENRCPDAPGRPVFVEIVRRLSAEPESLAAEAPELVSLIGKVLERPEANIHVLYPPPGEYRVAFGGVFPED